MRVHQLVNRYSLYCRLVGEVRYLRQREHSSTSAPRFSPEQYRVPRNEFSESIAGIERWLGMKVTQPERWYRLPLYNIWGRVEVAQRSKARQIS